MEQQRFTGFGNWPPARPVFAARPVPEVYAAEAHAGQTYGSEPYTAHLAAVVSVVRDADDPGVDPDFLETVAWLHDVVEDTDVTEAALADTFGHAVASAVSCISDPEGHNRRERKARLHSRLRSFHDRLPVERAVLLVKVADRLANARTAAADGNGHLSMYRREHAAFRAAAYRPGLCDALWAELDALLGE